jgi:hypothetical protein
MLQLVGHRIIDFLFSASYDPKNPTYSHFTQVVWKATTELGCSLYICNNNNIFDASIYGVSLILFCSGLILTAFAT